MSNHLAAIGFPVENDEQFEALALTALSKGTETEPLKEGWRTVRWDLDGGPSLWLHLSERESIECFTPALRSEAANRLFLSSYFEAPECVHCAGIVLEHRGGADDSETILSFAAQAPNVVTLRGSLPVGGSHLVSLAAFGEQVEMVPADDPGPDHFDPIGMQAARGGRVEATALVEAEVLQSELRKNPVSGEKWNWTKLRSFGLEFEAALPRAAAPSGIRSGSRVRGRFFFTGLIEAAPPRVPGRPSAWASLHRTGSE